MRPRRHDIADGDAPIAAQARASSFSSLPSTRATSGIAAKMSGEDCAAQPVTTMSRCRLLALDAADRLPGLAHGFRRHRAGVDDDGVVALRRALDDFRLDDIEPAAEGDDVEAHGAGAFSNSAGIELAGELELHRPGHQHVAVALAPVDGEFAAGQRHLHLAIGALEPRRGDRGGAGRRAAGARQPGAALPGADDDVRRAKRYAPA